MLSGVPESAVYVQNPDDSRNSAIRIAYRNSLRPSSSLEPRHSSLKFSTVGAYVYATDWVSHPSTRMYHTHYEQRREEIYSGKEKHVGQSSG